MTNNKFHLFQLQKIDTRLNTLQIEIENFLLQLENDPALITANRENTLVSNKHLEVTNQLSEVENQISRKRVKLEQSESNLYQGKITNPKELQDLQKEVAILHNQISTLEESQLEILYQLEKLQTELATVSGILQDAIQANKQSNDSMRRKIKTIESEKTKLADEKNVILSQLPQELIRKYEELYSRKKGLVISKIDEGACGVCGFSLTPSDHQQAKSPISLTFCPSCGRILYAD